MVRPNSEEQECERIFCKKIYTLCNPTNKSLRQEPLCNDRIRHFSVQALLCNFPGIVEIAKFFKDTPLPVPHQIILHIEVKRVFLENV